MEKIIPNNVKIKASNSDGTAHEIYINGKKIEDIVCSMRVTGSQKDDERTRVFLELLVHDVDVDTIGKDGKSIRMQSTTYGLHDTRFTIGGEKIDKDFDISIDADFEKDERYPKVTLK